MDSKKIFYYGEVYYKIFLNTIKECWKGTAFAEPYIYSMLTNQAFACELYLKSILVDENVRIKGHDLSQLFDKLKNKTQQDIIRIYITDSENNIKSKEMFKALDKLGLGMNFENNHFEIKNVLETVKRDFQKFRYFFEEPQNYRSHQIHYLVKAIRKYIIETHPDWETINELPNREQ